MWSWTRVAIVVGVALTLGGCAGRTQADRAVERLLEADRAGSTGASGGTAPGATAAGEPVERFDTSMVEGLPAPARRYLLHTIAPGTPLARSVELEMSGSILLKRDGDPLPMRAHQVVNAERGFIWRARVARGLMRIRGYDLFIDDDGEMRWWLWGLFPVVNESGEDYAKSARGRLATEAVLMLPSMLLPSRGAQWEAVDEGTARVRLPATGEPEPITVEVDEAGRLVRVEIMRWNGDPANGPVGRMPFGGDSFGEERSFGGYTVPTSMRAGWRLGAEDEYAFFHAVLESVTYR